MAGKATDQTCLSQILISARKATTKFH